MNESFVATISINSAAAHPVPAAAPQNEDQEEEAPIMKTLALATAAIGLAVTATPAIAGGDESKMVVKYDDLNLSTKAGQEHLERRIDAAAKKVCGLTNRTGTRIQNTKAQRCYQEAKSKAHAAFAGMIEENRLGG